jgi:hypothetical protein
MDHPTFLELANKVRALERGCRYIIDSWFPAQEGSCPDSDSVVSSKRVSQFIIVVTRFSDNLFSFVPLPKSANPERINSNLDVFNFELTDQDMAKLDSLDRGKEGAVTWNPVDAP